MLIATHKIAVHAVTNDISLRNKNVIWDHNSAGAHFLFVVPTTSRDQTKESVLLSCKYSDRGGL